MTQSIKNNGLLTEEKSVISAFARVQQGSPILLNDMERICGIYKITSPKGRIYIGQSVNCLHRRNQYKWGESILQVKLHRSIQKYGWDAHKFEIIHQCTREELNDLEVYYIELFQCFNTEHGLNLRSGGNVFKFSDETNRKNSERRTKKEKGNRMSLYTGVHFVKRGEFGKLKKQWHTRIHINGVKVFQRYFNTEREAALAADYVFIKYKLYDKLNILKPIIN